MTKGRFNRAGKWVNVDLPDIPKPIPEQVEDIHHLISRNVAYLSDGKRALFNEPGTGKTLTALWAYQKIHRIAHRCIIVCPGIAIRNWIKHILAVMPWAYVQEITGARDEISPNADFVVVTYGMLARNSANIVERLVEWTARVVILDEAHRLSSMFANKKVDAIFGKLCRAEDCIISSAMYVWPLTGTPVTRHYDGLYPILRSLAYRLLVQYDVNTFAKFRAVFCELQKYRVRPGIIEERSTNSINHELMDKLLYDSGFAVRRRLVDVAKNMPILVTRENVIEFTPSIELMALQAELEADRVDDYIRELNPKFGVAIHKVGMEKVPAVIEFVKAETAPTESVLILYWHTDVGKKITDELRKTYPRVERIGGDTPRDQSDEYVDMFNRGELKAVVGQIAAMGEALDLQKGCHRVIAAERPFSYAQLMQAFRRVYRWGNKAAHIQVDYIIAPGILTEDLQSSILERKQEVVER